MVVSVWLTVIHGDVVLLHVENEIEEVHVSTWRACLIQLKPIRFENRKF
jgi:hypothetical protein